MGQKLILEIPDRVLRVLSRIAREEGKLPEEVVTQWIASAAEHISGERLGGFQVAQRLLKERRDEILKIASRHGVTNLRIFGSFARGQEDAESDLDLLVDLEQGRDLLDLIGLKHDLEDFLGVGVDVLTEPALSPYIRERILKESVSL